MTERILLAVDGSPASQRALEYVRDMVGWQAERYLHLVHVLPPVLVPSNSLQPAPRAKGENEARALLTRMREHISAGGVDLQHVDVGLLYLRPDLTLADGLLDCARDQSCETIIVGRNSLPWYRELFHHHPADELAHKARGFTIWIVE